MLKLEKGRPADCAGRLEKEVRTYDFLDKLNIEYEQVIMRRHDRWTCARRSMKRSAQ